MSLAPPTSPRLHGRSRSLSPNPRQGTTSSPSLPQLLAPPMRTTSLTPSPRLTRHSWSPAHSPTLHHHVRSTLNLFYRSKDSPSGQQLHLAALQGNIELLKRTLDGGRVHIDSQDKEGTTPLILAAANNHYGCVRELLDQGASPHIRRHTGTCALFFAAQGGFLDIVKLLLDKGAPVEHPPDGGTPLFVACQCNHLAVVRELLGRGANIHATMADGATPLFIAAQNGHCKLLRFLLSKGANENQIRKDRATPLWIASQMGHADIVKELLDAGAQVDAAREDGATPLFKAAHKGHVEVVRSLVNHGATFELLNNGESALHAAALFGHLKVVKDLVAAGANVNLKNKEGQTPAELARDAGYDVIAEFLLKARPSYQTTV
ncbi:PREDICTED: ankyrin repeat domain-containing protein 29-like [Branchiostoma belcheri]|uniref:Ankyrin repeat domain-containing protein 29-like n=1 Tax=Branchiostoma belcheri TaxID=7741 RepID=A0A6P4Y4B7_BRABE|nr:PREDICTED: ankyrin repeat domain-containing protein 29-like [Branchiostoma belcheri]